MAATASGPASFPAHALTTGIGAWWPHRFEDEGSTVQLEPWVGADGGGTIVRTHAEMLGRFDEETVAGYRAGNQAVVEALKSFVEGSPSG
jgi:hypothetical protein